MWEWYYNLRHSESQQHGNEPQFYTQQLYLHGRSPQYLAVYQNVWCQSEVRCGDKEQISAP